MSAEIHGFADDADKVTRIARRLGAPHAITDLHRFPDGEVLPTAPVPAPRTVIFYRSLHHPNARLTPLLLAADAYRRAGAARLVLVAPYLCYLRQDAVFRPGQSLSRDVVGALLGHAFDRIVTVQAHLHRTTSLSDAFGTPVDNLVVSEWLASLLAGSPAPLVVGPDEESWPWVRSAAKRISSDALVLTKRRLGDREVELSLPEAAPVRGRAALLIDDICASGGTLERAIRLLREAGAATVDVAVAHALFDRETEARLRLAGARRIVSTESVPHPTNTLALDHLIAEALRNELRP